MNTRVAIPNTFKKSMLSDQARSGGSDGLLLYVEAVKVSHNFIIGPWSNCGVKQ
jgi:hypothetical protein